MKFDLISIALHSKQFTSTEETRIQEGDEGLQERACVR